MKKRTKKYKSEPIHHAIRENRVGLYITNCDDSPNFDSVDKLLKWANRRKIIITRERPKK